MYWPENPFDKNQELYEHLKKDFTNPELVSEIGLKQCEENFMSIVKQLTIPPAFTTVRLGMNAKPEQAVEHVVQATFATLVDLHPLFPDLLLVKSLHPFPDFNVTPDGKEVVVGLQCGEAVLRGAPVYAAGVLGAPTGLNSDDRVSIYADLDGKCLRGSKKPFEGRKVFVGNGKAVLSRDDLFKTSNPRGMAIDVTVPVCNCPPASVLQQVGVLQNLPSIVCVHILDPRPFDWIIDMCAAPGGKTTHIGTLMEDKGILVALDKTTSRVNKLKENVLTYGLTCVRCFTHDSTKCVDDRRTSDDASLIRNISEEKEEELLNDYLRPPYPEGLFDKVLLDAPCSGLGRRPQLANKMTLAEVRSFPALQRKLFSAAARLLRLGGILVYSTCTLTIAENEDLVRWALQEYHQLRLEELNPAIGGPGLPCSNLLQSDRRKLKRFHTTSQDVTSVNTDTIGFFIAKFKKISM